MFIIQDWWLKQFDSLLSQALQKRDEEWAEHNKKHLNLAINSYDIVLPPELIKNLSTLNTK